MTPPPADLLERLRRGDVAAAEALFDAYTPYLRAVVRRQISDKLRTEFDSCDVAQSVWVRVVRQLHRDGWRVNDEAELRGLLVTIARRRLVDRAHKHAHDADAGRPGPGGLEAVAESHRPRPSEEAQADELWSKMLRLCPPEHRDVLVLRRQGLPLTEVAARTGLHEGSVRRILRRLSREVALGHGPLADGVQ